MFKGNGSKHKKTTFIWTLFSPFVSCNLLCWLYILLITRSGDVELNPGPKRKASQTLSICHWNLNSICVHNFAKSSLLRAYVSVHKFDIICLSEKYLDLNPISVTVILPNVRKYTVFILWRPSSKSKIKSFRVRLLSDS